MHIENNEVIYNKDQEKLEVDDDLYIKDKREYNVLWI